MSGGDSYGASLAASATSGISNSGAVSQKGGGNFGGFSYGPGSVVRPGQSQTTPLSSLFYVVTVVVAAVVLIPLFFRRKP